MKFKIEDIIGNPSEGDKKQELAKKVLLESLQAQNIKNGGAKTNEMHSERINIDNGRLYYEAQLADSVGGNAKNVFRGTMETGAGLEKALSESRTPEFIAQIAPQNISSEDAHLKGAMPKSPAKEEIIENRQKRKDAEKPYA